MQTQPVAKRFKGTDVRYGVIRAALVASVTSFMMVVFDLLLGSTNVARRGIMPRIAVSGSQYRAP